MILYSYRLLDSQYKYRMTRAAGFDPQSAGTVALPAGIIDVRRYSIVSDPNPAMDPVIDPAGSPVLTVTSDLNSDGVLEQSTYLIYDIDNDGINDLASSTGPGVYELVAEGIAAMGFAFAIDDDLDGELDTIDPANPNSNIIWAVDANNDNLLDTNLDTNDDGVIDTLDDGNSNHLIESTDNAFGALATPVALDRIRMVRIWLLSRSIRRAQVNINEVNAANQFYLVGDQLIAHVNDGFRRRALEVSVTCRNTGLK